MAIKSLARAKVNLCLHVTGKRSDGYHLLDSIVVFADVRDQVIIEPAKDLSLSITGPFASKLNVSDDNLVLMAAQTFGCVNAKIELEKNLPVASGIGGGSADAAATLIGISKLSKQPLPIDRGLSLGSDVPVCVASIPCRMQGIGEIITPLQTMPKMHAVMVCPDSAVSTAKVFGELKQTDNASLSSVPIQDLSYDQLIQYLDTTRNDMQAAAIKIAPVIGDVLAAIESSGADFSRMSGSGATCFGLFSNKQNAENAAKIISKNHQNWWVMATCLNNS